MIIDIDKFLIIFCSSIFLYALNDKFFNFHKKKREKHQKYINDKIALPLGGFTILLFIIFFIFFFNYI